MDMRKGNIFHFPSSLSTLTASFSSYIVSWYCADAYAVTIATNVDRYTGYGLRCLNKLVK